LNPDGLRPAGAPAALALALACALGAQAAAAGEPPAADYERMRAALADRIVFFDPGETTVDDEQADIIIAHLRLAEAYPNERIVLQGFSDERGDAACNLALGRRRAEAVKRQLVLLGLDPARIETESLGAQRPRAACHEEKCWALNRRVEFVHRAPLR